jgi:hypothetical protein
MLVQAFWPGKAADRMIMSCYLFAALWIFQEARPKIVDAPLILICMMGQ